MESQALARVQRWVDDLVVQVRDQIAPLKAKLGMVEDQVAELDARLRQRGPDAAAQGRLQEQLDAVRAHIERLERPQNRRVLPSHALTIRVDATGVGNATFKPSLDIELAFMVATVFDPFGLEAAGMAWRPTGQEAVTLWSPTEDIADADYPPLSHLCAPSLEHAERYPSGVRGLKVARGERYDFRLLNLRGVAPYDVVITFYRYAEAC